MKLTALFENIVLQKSVSRHYLFTWIFASRVFTGSLEFCFFLSITNVLIGSFERM